MLPTTYQGHVLEVSMALIEITETSLVLSGKLASQNRPLTVSNTTHQQTMVLLLGCGVSQNGQRLTTPTGKEEVTV